MAKFLLYLNEKIVPNHVIQGGSYSDPMEQEFLPQSDIKSHLNDMMKHFDMKHFNNNYYHPRKTITEYKDNSVKFNRHLRENSIAYLVSHQNFKDHIKNLDDITSYRIKKPLLVYRGFGHDDNDMKKIHSLPRGRIIHDLGYTGTSLSPAIAYINGTSGKSPVLKNIENFPMNVKHIAQIHLPTGTHGFYIDGIEHDRPLLRKENEFLLHRGSSFRVLGHSIKKIFLDSGYPQDFRPHVHVMHLGLIHQNV